jgi:hypothetical protein
MKKKKKKKGEVCVTYGGQNYVHKFERPMHTGKENSRRRLEW